MTIGVSGSLGHGSTRDAPGTKLNVTFDFQPGLALAGCFIGCADMYPELIQTCQFNSHNIVGKSMLVQECGNFTIAINPPEWTDGPVSRSSANCGNVLVFWYLLVVP